MGNSAFKHYDVDTQINASGGPGLSWKIYEARHKETDQLCSTWLFDKKMISDAKPQTQQRFVELLKKDAQTLGRLRHPLILRLNKPMEETKNEIYFETEPVLASLANALGNTKNTQQIRRNLMKISMDEVDIKLGLIQIFECLNFIHSTAKMIHMNLTPENIFITADGKWKIGGFGFSTYLMYIDKEESKYSYDSFDQSDDKYTLPIKPSLNYIAPEYIFLNNCDTQSDLFSLGCVIYEIFTKKRLLNCDNNVSRYKADILNLFPLDMSLIPLGLQASLEKLLSQNLEKRYTSTELLEIKYFNDVTIRTLQYLNGIWDKDDKSKVEFFKGLRSTFPSFTENVLEERVLPVLIQELRNTILVPLVLPNIFKLCETLKDDTVFYRKVYPSLVPIMNIFNPYQIAQVFLSNIEFMAKRIKEADINTTLVNLVCSSLASNKEELQYHALQKSITVIATFEYQTITANILPKIITIITSKQSVKLRIFALFTLSKLVPLLSNPVVDSLIPGIYKMWKSERNAAYLMGLVGLCDAISQKLGTTATIFKILPLIITYMGETEIDKHQLETFNKIITQIIQRTYQSRLKGLDEKEKIASLKEDTEVSNKEDVLENFTRTLPKTSEMVTLSPIIPTNNISTIDPEKAEYYSVVLQRQENKLNELKKSSSLLDLEQSNDTNTDEFVWESESSNLFDNDPEHTFNDFTSFMLSPQVVTSKETSQMSSMNTTQKSEEFILKPSTQPISNEPVLNPNTHSEDLVLKPSNPYMSMENPFVFNSINSSPSNTNPKDDVLLPYKPSSMTSNPKDDVLIPSQSGTKSSTSNDDVLAPNNYNFSGFDFLEPHSNSTNSSNNANISTNDWLF